MIIAQYTIRSKQEYIFKTNRVLEIVGASENIARIWDVLFDVAKEIGLKYDRVDSPFEMNDIKKRVQEKSLNMVELFCGGGNETLMFDCDEIDDSSSFYKLNRAFTHRIILDYPGMVPMVVWTRVTEKYSDDYASLMREADRKKKTMEPLWNMFTVPFAMMDRNTFQPYSCVRSIGGHRIRMSKESAGKYDIGKKLREKNEDIRLFDEMITRRGEESLLAVVHADGNNMGAKIMGMLHGEEDYDKAIVLMRRFTKTTADCFEKKGEDALIKCNEKLRKENEKLIQREKIKLSSLAYRRLIGSGDDMTFICNARYAMDYVKAYLDAVQEYGNIFNSEWEYSSCAGICIFHSHYPFSGAYRIAEQACDDVAKERVHRSDMRGNPIEQGWLDFYYVHSGIEGDLEEIRKSQGISDCVARPWLVSYGSKDEDAKTQLFRYDRLLYLRRIFEKKRNEFGKEDRRRGVSVARSSIKSVGSAFEISEAAAKKELISLFGHTPGLEQDLRDLFSDEHDMLRAIYDYAEVYDLWYSEVK